MKPAVHDTCGARGPLTVAASAYDYYAWPRCRAQPPGDRTELPLTLQLVSSRTCCATRTGETVKPPIYSPCLDWPQEHRSITEIAVRPAAC